MSNILRFPEPNESVRERYEHAKVDFSIRFDENKNLKVTDNGTDPMITLSMIATAAGTIILRNFESEDEQAAAMYATCEVLAHTIDIVEEFKR